MTLVLLGRLWQEGKYVRVQVQNCKLKVLVESMPQSKVRVIYPFENEAPKGSIDDVCPRQPLADSVSSPGSPGDVNSMALLPREIRYS